MVNWASSHAEFIRQMWKYRNDEKEKAIDPVVSSLIISTPFFLEEDQWIPISPSWSLNIVSGKTYDTETEEGRILFEQISTKVDDVYDDLGRISTITMRLGESGPVQTVRDYEYKANGDLDYIRDYRQFEEGGQAYIDMVYELNGAGLPTEIKYTDSSNSATPKERYALTYDDRGYVLSENVTANYGAATVNKAYEYDEIGRLTEAVIGSKTQTYTYDDVGNRLTKNDGTTTFNYSYNEFNQLTSVKKGTVNYLSYTYDGRGNQIQEQEHETGTSYARTDYAYNLMNQMTQAGVVYWVGDPGNGYPMTYTQTNAYNAAGQRISKVENGLSTMYYYDGSAELYTTSAEGLMKTENVLDPGGMIIASKRFDQVETSPNAEGYYFYHYDVRGSVTNIIKPDGTKTKGYEYDEFGNLEQSGAAGFLNEVTFTGSITDASTGLQYMNARFYNPATGR